MGLVVGSMSVRRLLNWPVAGAPPKLLEPKVALKNAHEVVEPLPPVPLEFGRVIWVPQTQAAYEWANDTRGTVWPVGALNGARG